MPIGITRFSLVCLALLWLCITAMAQTPDAIAPLPIDKAPGAPYAPPASPRQGGDTIADAVAIPGLPYTDTGTTEGFNHDYTATCFSNTTAPDVVYRLVVPAGFDRIVVSLCGSTYDTGLIIYDAAMNQVGCNDDFCSLQSEVENLPVSAGATYYIVVTGYSSAAGAYTLEVTPPPPPCVITCPEDGYCWHEGEPDLNDNYIDNYNGGCNTSPGYPFQHLPGCHDYTLVFCGESGWYLANGGNSRDTDWFTLTVGPSGAVEIIADAEYACYIFELSGTCAGGVTVAQQATAGPCTEAYMTIAGAPGASKWFWVGTTVFVSPDGTREFDYIVWLDGLLSECCPTAPETWGTVKALFH